MASESMPRNPFQGVPEADYDQIMRVILTSVAPKVGLVLYDAEGRGASVSLGDGIVAHWSIDSTEEFQSPRLRRLLELDRSEKSKSILLIRPWLEPQAVKSMTDRLKRRLANILKGRKLPALEVWGASQVEERMKRFPPLWLRYYAEELADGRTRLDRIDSSRRRYDAAFRAHNDKIQFVGMSVYKEEATVAVEMGSIYIPLRLVDEDADETRPDVPRTDPLTVLKRGACHVILGDPGCGKSTLLRFLALAGAHEGLRQRYQTPPDDRLPVLVTVRQLADALKENPQTNLLDFIVRTTAADFDMSSLDRDVLLQTEWEERPARISYNFERRSSHGQEDTQAIDRPGEGRHPTAPSPRPHPHLRPV
jgi:hypothetical protein